MTYHCEPENICPVCLTKDCENEMCLPDAPLLMTGDETQPQLGAEGCREFFQPIDYVEDK